MRKLKKTEVKLLLAACRHADELKTIYIHLKQFKDKETRGERIRIVQELMRLSKDLGRIATSVSVRN